MDCETSDYNRNTEYGYGPYGGMDPEWERKAAKATRRCFSRVGLAYVMFLVMSYASQWIMVFFLALTGIGDRMSWNGYTLAVMLSMYPLTVPLMGLLMKGVPCLGKPEREEWGIGKLAGFFVVSMGMLYMGNFVGTMLMALAGLIKGEPIVNDMEELIISMEPWTVFLAAVITAPIMEELVFRKFLLDRIAGYGHWTAMLVSGVVFGVVHGNFYQFFYAFGLGMIFSYIYLHTGKIRYTIAFHMMINFMGSILPMGLIKVAELNSLFGTVLTIGNLMMMLGFIICAVILLVYFRHDLSFAPGILKITTEKKVCSVWLNVGMILFFICASMLFVAAL